VSEGNARFGSYLRALRESRKLTLQDVEYGTLHEAEPVTRSLLSRLENGKTSVSTLKLLALSRLYGVGFGLLAERLELDHELGEADDDPPDGAAPEELLLRARDAGLRGKIHRALLLYERAEAESLGQASRRKARIRARLGVARSLMAAGRFRSACRVLEDLSGDELETADRAWAFFLLCRGHQQLGRHLIARAVFSALDELGSGLPREIETQMPALRAELAAAEGRLDDALDGWLEALDAARAAGDTNAETYSLLCLAAIERRRENYAAAAAWAERGREMAQSLGFPFLLVKLWTETGRIERDRAQLDLARRAWTTGRRLARSLELYADLFDIYLELWRLAGRQRNEAEQRACLRSLKHLSRFLEALPPEARELRPHLDRHAAPRAGDAAEEEAR
jgi:transcriptional regulator with XRE-family HTH domain